MSSGLRDALIAQPPVETSGSRSHNRFDYQADWALCRLLELHAANTDYVIVFDYHDDVLVLDSLTDPQTIVFYQIKSRSSGEWTRAELTGRSNGSRSIVAKLYQHYLTFTAHTRGLRFVSNAGYSVRRHADRRATHCDNFVHSDLHADERRAVETALTTQLSTSQPLPGTALFQFERCDLSHLGHTDHARGKLIDFLESLPGTDEINLKAASAFFRSLKMEILRGSTDETNPATFDDLCRLKAISRIQFDDMLRKVQATAPQPNWSDIIRQRLAAEGVSFIATTRLCSQVNRFIANRFDPSDALLNDAVEAIASSLQIPQIESIGLDVAINTVFQQVRGHADVARLMQRFDAEYVRAVIGVLLHEQQAIPPASPNTEDEAS